MAARIMGIYTSPEGVTLALFSGARGKRQPTLTWFPSFTQPDGTLLYPAEEIHKRVWDLAPDTICLYDTATPVMPFSMTLPRMKPDQVYQALRIELETRSVMDLMDPVVGFFPGGGRGRKPKGAGLVGFGLAMEQEDLRELMKKYRPFGIMPDCVTLPIIPLALTFLLEIGEDPALVFLLEGSLAMVAVIRKSRIEALEAFYGGEEALADRIAEWRTEIPDLSLYGFEAGERGSPEEMPGIRFVKSQLTEGEKGDTRFLTRERVRVSRGALAMLLARLPSLLGTFEYGGIHTREKAHPGEKKGHRLMALSFGLIVLVLFGVGAGYGILTGVDRHIYRQQKDAIHWAIRSLLPNAPSVGGIAILQAKKLEFARLRSHLGPMFAPSTLSLPMQVLPLLNRLVGGHILSIDAFPDHVKLVLAPSHPIDRDKLMADMERQGGIQVEFLPLGRKGTPEAGTDQIVTLLITKPKGKREARHAE